jgi:hypothetical protein
MEFLDPTTIRETLDEEALRIKTGIRAGQADPPPPINDYGVLPDPISAQ